MGDHIFIIYARSDEAFVLKFAQQLKDRGVNIFVDQWDILPSQDWDQNIEDAIYGCAQCLVVLSEASVQSREVRDEWHTALNARKTIVPVLHQDCRIPRQLSLIQYIDFSSRQPDDEAGIAQVLRVLGATGGLQAAQEQEKEVTPDAVAEEKGTGFHEDQQSAREAVIEETEAGVPAESMADVVQETLAQESKHTKRQEPTTPALSSPVSGHQNSLKPMWTGLGVVLLVVIIWGIIALKGMYTDDQAYQQAMMQNTTASYGEYLRAWPKGRHTAEALTQIQPLYEAETLPGGAAMEFVYIPPGSFVMGSPSTESERDTDEGPQHEATISQGFYLEKYEVTQGQWQAVMSTTPWSGESYEPSNPNHPAVDVSWNDAQAFVQKLNAAAGDSLYRLPTEAEWEYACRAGTTTRWSFGDDETQLKDYAWYDKNAWDVGEQYAHAVGTKLSNPWGLYDMHGNVWEWCQDWYGDYSSSAQTDPTSPASGSYRVIRGGSFYISAQYTRSANRFYVVPSGRYYDVGFRLLRRAK